MVSKKSTLPRLNISNTIAFSSNPDATISAGGEIHQLAGGQHETLTNNQGLPISDNQNLLKAGPRGPTLLEDIILREKIFHLNHERIPECVGHARGTAAHGTFELSRSLAQYTTAKILTEVGEKIPLFTRISTVAGGAGFSDMPRDVRGFAVKLYTKQGKWDLVGNSTQCSLSKTRSSSPTSYTP